MTQLRYLDLHNTKITDAGMVHLKGLTQLTGLSLWGTKVTDAGLANLRGLSQLRDIDLNGTEVTDAGAKDLEKALPKVKIWRAFDADRTKDAPTKPS
jgi:hypothetical protein